ncbi:DHH phosphoesterase [Paraphaeosphaeria sporulosa]|uniref:DHH phosphoesterase n=1 Tax=Paraphaeosphaeria sporulosa TaxID=1460663 RepID=A0A177C4N0_9PLEO|nr:DHH phosphoesterase [Paraphaeosphaeria sporulosa]OAG01832.1 DHH phosphoesterase [Paraphaeosphaeria sporulosa]
MSLVSRVLPRLSRGLNHTAYRPITSFLLVSTPHTFHTTYMMSSPAKRKAETQASPAKAKKPKVQIPEYHLTPSRRDEDGEIVWPAPKAQIERAREIIRECASAQKPTLILPDKDADGLSSGAILHHTLTSLGLSSDLISVYFPPKGSNVHDESTRSTVTELSPAYIFVLDQGSRKTGPFYDASHKCLIIDHHFAEEGGFPEGAEFVTAHDCPPVATSALLTYAICLPLHQDLEDKISWLAALGTHGDLGNTLKWQPPFPDMTATFKRNPKKAINDAVGLVNAPRRSAAYNVQAAWEAVISVEGPQPLLSNEKLRDAQFEVKQETEKWSHVPPKFSRDATIAILTIRSAAQVHPVVATRWAGFLKSDKLEIVMCANEGYLPGKVNFSCRVAKHARARIGDDRVNIIQTLESIVADDPDLRARLGESFARGHKEASGGIINVQEWEEFKKLMGVGENSRKKAETKTPEKKKPAQKNTLQNYFVKAS